MRAGSQTGCEEKWRAIDRDVPLAITRSGYQLWGIEWSIALLFVESRE
jgi:hypothetical protein